MYKQDETNKESFADNVFKTFDSDAFENMAQGNSDNTNSPIPKFELPIKNPKVIIPKPGNEALLQKPNCLFSNSEALTTDLSNSSFYAAPEIFPLESSKTKQNQVLKTMMKEEKSDDPSVTFPKFMMRTQTSDQIFSMTDTFAEQPAQSSTCNAPHPLSWRFLDGCKYTDQETNKQGKEVISEHVLSKCAPSKETPNTLTLKSEALTGYSNSESEYLTKDVYSGRFHNEFQKCNTTPATKRSPRKNNRTFTKSEPLLDKSNTSEYKSKVSQHKPCVCFSESKVPITTNATYEKTSVSFPDKFQVETITQEESSFTRHFTYQDIDALPYTQNPSTLKDRAIHEQKSDDGRNTFENKESLIKTTAQGIDRALKKNGANIDSTKSKCEASQRKSNSLFPTSQELTDVLFQESDVTEQGILSLLFPNKIQDSVDQDTTQEETFGNSNTETSTSTHNSSIETESWRVLYESQNEVQKTSMQENENNSKSIIFKLDLLTNKQRTPFSNSEALLENSSKKSSSTKMSSTGVQNNIHDVSGTTLQRKNPDAFYSTSSKPKAFRDKTTPVFPHTKALADGCINERLDKKRYRSIFDNPEYPFSRSTLYPRNILPAILKSETLSGRRGKESSYKTYEISPHKNKDDNSDTKAPKYPTKRKPSTTKNKTFNDNPGKKPANLAQELSSPYRFWKNHITWISVLFVLQTYVFSKK